MKELTFEDEQLRLGADGIADAVFGHAFESFRLISSVLPGRLHAQDGAAGEVVDHVPEGVKYRVNEKAPRASFSSNLDWEKGILLPFLLQVMCGVGSPSAAQRKAAMLPTFTRWSSGASEITGGSAREEGEGAKLRLRAHTYLADVRRANLG